MTIDLRYRRKGVTRMKPSAIHGLLLTTAVLTVFAVAAAPAQATITPAGEESSWKSKNASWTMGGASITCPTSEITEVIDATGSTLSSRTTFSRSLPPDPESTCLDSFGMSVGDPGCTGSVTRRSGSSVGGTSASGSIAFDSGYRCTFRHPLIGTITVSGPQTPGNCAWTLVQASQTISINCRTIVSNRGSVNYTGAYRLVTGRRVTIS